MHKRIVIYSEEIGIYLGNCMGLGFWSKLDPVGQDAAVTFRNTDEAQSHVNEWNNKEPNLQFLEVETKDETYATIKEIEAAGLPGWDPNLVPDVNLDELEEVPV